jgi:hypothetical protein
MWLVLGAKALRRLIQIDQGGGCGRAPAEPPRSARGPPHLLPLPPARLLLATANYLGQLIVDNVLNSLGAQRTTDYRAIPRVVYGAIR